MAKSRTTAFFCKECGYESAKWMGQCPSCHAWNTMTEEPIAQTPKHKAYVSSERIAVQKPSYIDEIATDDKDRFDTGFEEFNRVLGGGIVPGSLVLVGGDPGIGKSTLLLQVCRKLALAGKSVLYISGEESLKQIKLRANRIGKLEGELRFLCETNLDNIETILSADKPDVVVIDSIQTMFRSDIASAPGSVSQVRETTNMLLQIAKGMGIAILIVGHMTKDGQVAGPRVLEHMVDTVLYFEGERSVSYRILRAVKNRFGSTNEIGVFEMAGEGLKEVPNPSEYMLSGRPIGASGAVVACSMEGTRPMLLELQALVSETAFGFPRRTAVGIDFNRVNILMAVIEKRCRLPMSRYDAYINLAGGMRISEPALDLALVLAIVSSYRNIPIDEKTVVFGEVGLSGEIRAVTYPDIRVREAAKLGFTKCIMPYISLSKIKIPKDIECVGVKGISDAIDLIFS